MSNRRRAVTAAATFFLAAATGHVMQQGFLSGHQSRSGDTPISGSLQETSLTSSADATTTSGAAAGSGGQPLAAALRADIPAFPDLPALEPLALAADKGLATRIASTRADDFWPMDAPSRQEFDNHGRACADPALVLTAAPGAMLHVALDAVCGAGQPVTFSHAGLSFSAPLDDRGHYETDIPALAANGAVSVRLPTGAPLSAAQPVPDLAGLVRTAIVSRGRAGLALSATLTASDGKPHPIDVQHPGQPGARTDGFLTLLGDPGLDRPVLAEVLTLPAELKEAGTRISAEVGPDTCGRDLLATTATLHPGDLRPALGAITFAMPDCGKDAGGRLVMNLDEAARAVAMAANAATPASTPAATVQR